MKICVDGTSLHYPEVVQEAGIQYHSIGRATVVRNTTQT